MLSNKLHFDHLNFSLLIRTQIECINKELLVDINWPNKAHALL